MKKLKRALSVLAAAFMLTAQFSPSVSADMLDGETTRSFRSLTNGVGYCEYVLGAASSYGVQEFSAVAFDCARDDLRFDVLPAAAGSNGSGSFADTVNAFRRHGSRHVIAALSADVGDGGETACGYTAYGGAMICSGTGSSGVTGSSGSTGSSGGIGNAGGVGSPVGTEGAGVIEDSGAQSCSFGVAADGSAMIGEISLHIEMRNRRTGETLHSGALNCFPQSEHLALYTDIGAANLPYGTCALAVEVAPGYSLTPGAPVEGTVIGALSPGGSYATNCDPESANGGVISTPAVTGAAINAPNTASAESSRVFIAARGDASVFSGFETGDRITLTADISEASGRTALWRTVSCAVGGIALVRHGEKVCFADQTPAGSSEAAGASDAAGAAGASGAAVIGIRPDGSAVMLASYGGQKGYSLGFTLSDLAHVCMTLGMTDAIVLSTGENVMMLCESENASLVPTGKSAGKIPSGALVISVHDSGAPSPDSSHAGETDAGGEYKDHSPAVLAAKNAGYSAALADGSELFRRMSAATVPHAPTQCCDAASLRAVFLRADTAGDQASICSLYRQLEFEATGEWLTLVIKESDLDAWYGKIFPGTL